MRNPYIRLAIIIVILGGIIYLVVDYILGLPTREERVLIGFMRDFRRGDYEDASEWCEGGSFFKIVDKSTVTDTDGAVIVWKNNVALWSEPLLQFAVETYIRPHLRQVTWRHLATQRMDNGTEAAVHFLFDFTVHDYMSGGGHLIAPEVYHGSAEGDCFLVKAPDGSWVIEHFELTLINTEGMDLKGYLDDI